MARISQYAHLKPEIERLYCNGKVPSDLFTLFPNIPQQTLRDWFAAGLKQRRWFEQLPPQLPSMTIRESSVSVFGEDEDIDDYTWAKRETKRLILEGFSDSTKIAAMGVFIQLLKMKTTVQVEATVKPDTRPYAEMTTDELSRLYRAKLENDFN